MTEVEINSRYTTITIDGKAKRYETALIEQEYRKVNRVEIHTPQLLPRGVRWISPNVDSCIIEIAPHVQGGFYESPGSYDEREWPYLVVQVTWKALTRHVQKGGDVAAKGFIPISTTQDAQIVRAGFATMPFGRPEHFVVPLFGFDSTKVVYQFSTDMMLAVTEGGGDVWPFVDSDALLFGLLDDIPNMIAHRWCKKIVGVQAVKSMKFLPSQFEISVANNFHRSLGEVWKNYGVMDRLGDMTWPKAAVEHVGDWISDGKLPDMDVRQFFTDVYNRLPGMPDDGSLEQKLDAAKKLKLEMQEAAQSQVIAAPVFTTSTNGSFIYNTGNSTL